MSDTRTFRVVDEDGDYYEITGDPMDALNAAYRERAHLVALLARDYPSLWTPGEDDPEWRIVFVELPTGQASWHISPADWELFAHVPQGLVGAWDGHSTEEKYRRIGALADMSKGPDEQPQDGPLTVAELAELTASIEHLSGPDAWDEDRLEPALIPVTHYVPRLLAMVAQGQQQDERDGDVRAVAPELRQEFGVQAEHSTSAFSTRTKQAARKLAATYSRVREPGCKPTPHHAVTRFSSDWQRLPDEAGVELDAREAKASER